MGCGHFIRGLSLFLQVGVAGAVIGITVAQLANYSWDSNGVTQQCAMGDDSRIGVSYCTVNYIVAGASIGATMVLGLLMCLTCNLCGLGPVLDLVFAAAGAVWWGVPGAGVYLAQTGDALESAPKQDWRLAVCYLYWSAAGLFAVTFLASCVSIISNCCCGGPGCSCCGGGGGAPRSGSKKYSDVEAARPVVIASHGYPHPSSYSGAGGRAPSQFMYK